MSGKITPEAALFMGGCQVTRISRKMKKKVVLGKSHLAF
jgi:hypothetical protein